jgi:two-component system, NtrC family, response regulator PilR
MAKILIVDDERSMREFLEIFLLKKGHEITLAENGKLAIEILEGSEFDLVITDLRMPEADGMTVLQETKRNWPDTQVIVVTAFSTTETAVEAMKAGAYDYIAKPFKINEAGVVIDKALEKRDLVLDNQRLKREVARHFSVENIIGRSERMQKVYRTIRQIADTRTNVILYGESGTGKELVARALHYNSSRADHPFVVINCGAIPDNLMESELFGHVRGSFTGAIADKKGLFEMANKGSLFLDEIGELSSHLQVKLLRALQERKIKPVGGLRENDIDVRLIAATNKDLEEEVRLGNFRDDLYFRINVIQINLPPLRDRLSDIPLLAHHFLTRYIEELGKPILGFSKQALALMKQYDYPGNVRELENVVQRAVAFEQTEWITAESLPSRLRGLRNERTDPGLVSLPEALEGNFSLDTFIEQVEQKLITQTMLSANGSVTEAGKKLGISFRAMRYKLSKYGIRKEDFE